MACHLGSGLKRGCESRVCVLGRQGHVQCACEAYCSAWWLRYSVELWRGERNMSMCRDFFHVEEVLLVGFEGLMYVFDVTSTEGRRQCGGGCVRYMGWKQ